MDTTNNFEIFVKLTYICLAHRKPSELVVWRLDMGVSQFHFGKVREAY